MNHNCKIRIVAAALSALLICPAISARQLNLDEAIGKAVKESKVAMLRGSRSAADGLKLVHTETLDGLNTVYVLNRQEGGFVIMSADDTGAPVLGYSDSGRIDPDNMDSGLAAWLESRSQEIVRASQAGLTPYESSSAIDLEPIGPLMKTTWNQGSPYNDKCPTIDGQSTYAGCVAVAVGQVMKYHNWPEHGKGTPRWKWSYTLNGQTYTVPQTIDLNNTTFQWDKMLDYYDSSEPGHQTAENEDAIATLMYAVGVASQMNWSTVGSGANLGNAENGLVNYFNYATSINYVSREYFTMEEWYKLLHDNFVNYGPVVLEGYNDNNRATGHSFVTDGYSSDGYFHINWGWGGMSDGYFKLEALNPSKQGAGGSVAGYSHKVFAIIGICPPRDNLKPTTLVVASGDFMSRKDPNTSSSNVSGAIQMTFDRSERINFFDNTSTGCGQFINYLPMYCQGGVKLVAEDGSVSYIWDNDGRVRKESGHRFWKIPIDASSFPASGTYKVTAVAKVGDDIYDFKFAPGKNRELKLVATESALEFSAPEDFKPTDIKVSNVVAPSNIYVTGKAHIKVDIANIGAEYQGSLQPRLMDADGNLNVGRMRPSFAAIPAGETATFEWDEAFSSDVPKGNYKLYFVDVTTPALPVTLEGIDPVDITIVDEGRVNLKISDIEFVGNTGTVAVPGRGVNATMIPRQLNMNLRITSDVACEQIIYAYIYPVNGSSQADQTTVTSRLSDKEPNNVNISKTLNTRIADGEFYNIRFYNSYSGGKSSYDVKDANGLSVTYHIYIDPKGGIEMIGSDNSLDVKVESGSLAVNAGSMIQTVEIYSMSGNKVVAAQFAGDSTSETVDISSLADGIYIARLTTASGPKVVKFIK